MTKENIPYQIQSIVDSMLDTKESVYIRNNFRARLDLIKAEIEKAIVKFDAEINKEDEKKNHRKKKRQYFSTF